MTDLDELRAELDEFARPAKKAGLSPREERVVAGFEEIQRFVESQGREPRHGEHQDIFERLYAVRLERLRALSEWRTLLQPLDYQGLLAVPAVAEGSPTEALTDDELMAALAGAAGGADITELRNVRSRAEIRAAEEVAQREPCADFAQFEPLFVEVEADLQSGERQTLRFGRDAAINAGEFFILMGQTAYVADKGEEFTTPQGHPDARLRVIYANGTESNLLLRSLQRALYKDAAGRRISDPHAGPLFGDHGDADDQESGTIYVLRSLSEHPYVREHRELVHKIGVTGSTVESRIAGAAQDPTYLLADVEIVATYKLAGINRRKLEALFHRIFAPARLDLTLQDRFGKPVQPREWFLVPLAVIDEAVQCVREGSITARRYDPKSARLLPLQEG
ncbi:MAG: GIY-YIG nuclease family protein [Halioglobus sp.]